MNQRTERLEWGQVYAAYPISKEAAESYRLVNFGASMLEPVLQDMLIGTVRGYFLQGAPIDVSVSVSAPKNLWAYIRKALGLSYKSKTRTNTKTIHRRVCPHGQLPFQKHLEFLIEEQ